MKISRNEPSRFVDLAAQRLEWHKTVEKQVRKLKGQSKANVDANTTEVV